MEHFNNVMLSHVFLFAQELPSYLNAVQPQRVQRKTSDLVMASIRNHGHSNVNNLSLDFADGQLR